MAELTGSYVPLNRIQRRLLRAVRPWTDRLDFFDGSGAVAQEVTGFESTSVLPLLRELESVGYLKILTDRDGYTPRVFVLSSAGRAYTHLAAWHLFKVALFGLIRIGSGCAGGLVVWFLTRLIP